MKNINQLPLRYLFLVLFVISAGQVLFLFYVNNLESEIQYQYSTLQSKYDLLPSIQAKQDQIVYLSGVYTSQSISILESILFDDFYKQDKEDLTKKYKEGTINYPTYWSKVLAFYNEMSNEAIGQISTQVYLIAQLKEKKNNADLWLVIYTILASSVTVVLSIFISVRVGKFIDYQT